MEEGKIQWEIAGMMAKVEVILFRWVDVASPENSDSQAEEENYHILGEQWVRGGVIASKLFLWRCYSVFFFSFLFSFIH